MPPRRSNALLAVPAYRQGPPNAVQIELVEGCSLACHFCGVQGIREHKGDYHFMTDDVLLGLRERLRLAMRKHGWNPRVEFAMHGEPTVHPRLVWAAKEFGSLKPRELILVSNGTGFLRDPNTLVPTLVRAGVTSICLDDYDGCDFVNRFRERYTGPVPVIDYDGTPGTKFRSSKREPPFIIVKGDVSRLTKPYDKLNTHCGGGCEPPPINPAIHKRCARPFREVSVRWDGNVAVCCNDFRGVYKVGNVLDFPSLEELWQHPRLYAARQMLCAGNRDFAPCKWCDALSPRVGLLPDRYGREHLPAPDETTRQVVEAAAAGAPYTAPVLRGWERDGEACLPPELLALGVGRLRVQPADD